MGLALQFIVRAQGQPPSRVAVHSSPALIGSGAGCAVRLDGPEIPDRMVQISEGPNGIVLARDLSGTGQMVINGVRLTQAEIRPQDILTLGSFELEVVEGHVMREVVDPDRYVRAADDPVQGFDVAELYTFWLDRVLDVRHLRQGEQFSVGTSEKSDLVLPEDVAGAGPHVVVNFPKGAMPTVNLKLDGVSGEVREPGGAIVDATEVARDLFYLEPGMRARVDVGAFTFLMSHTRAKAPPRSALMRRIEGAIALFLALSFVGHMAFMIGLTLVPEDPLMLSQARYKRRQQVIQVIQIAKEEKKQEEQQEKIRAKRQAKEHQKGDERLKTKKKSDSVLVSKLTPEEKKKKTKEMALKSGLAKEMESQTALIEEALNQGTNLLSAGDQAMKALVARTDGEGSASSLDPFGGALGAAGGGGMLGTLAVGGAAGGAAGMVAGLGKGDVEGDKVDVKFKKGKRKGLISLRGNMSVQGGYDKAIIRQYIRSRLRQLQWCHQKAIQRKADVGGKIVVQFAIMPTGKVLQPSVVHSNVGDQDLEQCLLSKIALWHFPPPKEAGATALVKYPFIFKVVK